MTKMPAASSKPNPPNMEAESQDPARQIVGIVERKIRNLEKRKTKLESYSAMVTDGKTLNKDQEEAVSHYQEVQGTLVFAKDLLITFAAIINDSSKALKKQARRDSMQRQETQLQRIRNLLLLQNVLYHMGQDHVRSDFTSGTNGAVVLSEEELNQLDELFKIANPSREEDEEVEEHKGDENGETKDESKSFEVKLTESSEHLNKFLREDDGEVCGTTYKNMKSLVHRINDCGYLDSVPEAPAEDPIQPPPEPIAQEDETFPDGDEEIIEPAPQEGDFTSQNMNSHQITSEVSAFGSSQPEQMTHQQSQMTQQMTQMTLQQAQMAQMPAPGNSEVPNAPGPIEMPPSKPPQTHDVNEVLAPVQGGFTFVQDSMMDFDSPHMDPAIVAVSQAYSTSTLQNSQDSSVHRHNTAVPSPVLQSESNVYSSQPEQNVYSNQNMYETQTLGGAPQHDFTSQQVMAAQSGHGNQQNIVNQQSLNTQQILNSQNTPSYMETQNFGPQSGLGGAQHGLPGSQQQSLSTGQVEANQNVGYGASDLPDFPTNPMDSQHKQDDQSSSLQSGGASSFQSHNQDRSQFGESYGQSALTGNQQSQYPARSGTNSPVTITDPSQSSLSFQNKMVSTIPSQYPPSSGTCSPVDPSQNSMSYSGKTGPTFSSQYPPTSETSMNDPSQNSMTYSGSMSLQQSQYQGDNGTSSPINDSSQSSFSKVQQPIKSTMNASAPPFQSTTRSSPQMQNLPDSTTGEDSSAFGSYDNQSQLSSSAAKPVDQKYGSSMQQTESDTTFQYSPYQAPGGGYKGNNRGRPRGGMGSPNFRNSRGMPFMRGPARYPSTNMQRGGYNQQFMGPPPRDNFQQRGPDMTYSSSPYNNYNRPQDPNYYRSGRGGMPQRGGNPRGGRGGNNRGQGGPYRGRGGNFNKPPVTA